MGPLVRLRRVLGMEHELDDPGAIAQVDEDQAAVVAAAVHPAGHAGLGVGAVGGQLAAPRVAVAVWPRGVLHGSRSPRRMAGMTFACGQLALLTGLHVLERDVPFSPTIATNRARIRSACLSWPFSERPASSS